jgi:Zn-finger protein
VNVGKRVEITHIKPPNNTIAKCENCTSIHPDSTRERVRQHVQEHGHTAYVTAFTTTRYTPLKGTP